MTKMTELITNKSEVGQLRKEVDSYKSKIEKWQTRAQALSKQVTDLGMKHSHDDRHKLHVSWIEDQDTENIEDRILSTSELTGASQNIAEPDENEEEEQDQGNWGIYACPRCGKTFAKKAKMMYHFRTKHAQ